MQLLDWALVRLQRCDLEKDGASIEILRGPKSVAQKVLAVLPEVLSRFLRAK